MEAVGAAQQRRNLAGLELGGRLDEHLRQPLGGTPAQRACAHGFGRVRERRRQPRKVAPPLQLAQDLLAPQALPLDLFGIGPFGDAQQDLRDVVLRRHRTAFALLGQERIDIGLADDQLGIDLALTQPADQHFFTDLLAKAAEADAVALELGAQLGRRGAIFFGQARHRAVELGVVDPQAGIPGRLRQRAIGDQALENLLAQLVFRRDRDAPLAQLALDRQATGLEFEHRDHVGVDHRHHPVDLDRLDGRARGARCGLGRNAAGHAHDRQQQWDWEFHSYPKNRDGRAGRSVGNR